MDEDLSVIIKEIRAMLVAHVVSSEAHFKESLKIAEVVTEMAQIQTTLPAVFKDVEYSSKELAQALRDVKSDLVKPATGTDRMDLKAVYMLMGFSLLVILLLGVVILADRVVGKDLAVSGQTPLASFTVQGQLIATPTPTKGP